MREKVLKAFSEIRLKGVCAVKLCKAEFEFNSANAPIDEGNVVEKRGSDKIFTFIEVTMSVLYGASSDRTERSTRMKSVFFPNFGTAWTPSKMFNSRSFWRINEKEHELSSASIWKWLSSTCMAFFCSTSGSNNSTIIDVSESCERYTSWWSGICLNWLASIKPEGRATWRAPPNSFFGINLGSSMRINFKFPDKLAHAIFMCRMWLPSPKLIFRIFARKYFPVPMCIPMLLYFTRRHFADRFRINISNMSRSFFF